MSVYVKRINANEYRVYQPIKLASAAPMMPLWQVDIFRAGWESYAPWTWWGRYLTHLVSRLDSAANWKVYAASAWTKVGAGWAASTRGTNDAETAAANSTDGFWTSADGDYATIDVEVPDAYGSGIIEVTQLVNSSTFYLDTGNTKIEVFKIVGGVEVPVALNGRGVSRMQVFDGGAHYGLLCDASYTTSTLTHWVRDRRGERR